MSLSCAVSEIQLARYIGRKSSILTYPTCIWRPVRDDPIRDYPFEFHGNFGTRKRSWRCFRDSAYSHFDTVPACDGQTDGETDTQRQRKCVSK